MRILCEAFQGPQLKVKVNVENNPFQAKKEGRLWGVCVYANTCSRTLCDPQSKTYMSLFSIRRITEFVGQGGTRI